ncbi:hypothetical protein Q0N88_25825 [Bacillus thuringiensis]
MTTKPANFTVFLPSQSKITEKSFSKIVVNFMLYSYAGMELPHTGYYVIKIKVVQIKERLSIYFGSLFFW